MWLFLLVHFSWTRTSCEHEPVSSVSQVRVQVEDLNESPQFLTEGYKASVFSIAPYKTSVVHVKVNTPSFCQFLFVGKHPLYVRSTNCNKTAEAAFISSVLCDSCTLNWNAAGCLLCAMWLMCQWSAVKHVTVRNLEGTDLFYQRDVIWRETASKRLKMSKVCISNSCPREFCKTWWIQYESIYLKLLGQL